MAVRASLLALLLLAVAAGICDGWRKRVPNTLTYPAILVGMLVGFLEGGLPGLGWSALGASAGLLGTLPLFALGGMGGGDVKLFAAIGALAGPWGLLFCFVASLLIGALFAVALLAWRGELLRTTGAILLHLATAATPWVKTAPLHAGARLNLRFGVPIALGAILFATYRELGPRLGF